ncbi:DUF2889 domain-containing protein [Paucibacter sp. DJ2R-2]|uniref:DUF2889 domain-containing protein n=1 Tax=Paucibacter sp. DJ2R-2 TaxID=2893558 RepID=UPI0021E4DC9D|nr:DUF2889 domain-containing protein [Paucibacter sp. DJ2R-2]MCV2419477.1 DUF2889 domain-containing protein [Paucibacter sp. DJ4R-1]MCV2437620.1 DUF2889 domain-containing protein [Paucibacter sp. DJ2R-2]
MPLPFPTSERRLLHRRAIDVQIYARDDGLYEVEAGLTDVKTRDLPLASGLRLAGDPIHAMQLVLTVDADLQIHAARSTTNWSPYAGVCDQHGDAYARLVGLNLMKGFRLGVKERLAGVKGCTHLTELCQILPTAVIQAFAGLVLDVREGSADGQPPFQLDRCHALRRDGDVVRNHYPRWYRSADAAARPAAVVAMPASSS